MTPAQGDGERVVAALKNDNDVLRAALVVARDRIFAGCTLVGAMCGDCNDIHEDGAEFVVRCVEFTHATRTLDSTDRSHERWELDAERRLAALRAALEGK